MRNFVEVSDHLAGAQLSQDGFHVLAVIVTMPTMAMVHVVVKSECLRRNLAQRWQPSRSVNLGQAREASRRLRWGEGPHPRGYGSLARCCEGRRSRSKRFVSPQGPTCFGRRGDRSPGQLGVAREGLPSMAGWRRPAREAHRFVRGTWRSPRRRAWSAPDQWTNRARPIGECAHDNPLRTSCA